MPPGGGGARGVKLCVGFLSTPDRVEDHALETQLPEEEHAHGDRAGTGTAPPEERPQREPLPSSSSSSETGKPAAAAGDWIFGTPKWSLGQPVVPSEANNRAPSSQRGVAAATCESRKREGASGASFAGEKSAWWHMVVKKHLQWIPHAAWIMGA
jgi:hypothetical protein